MITRCPLPGKSKDSLSVPSPLRFSSTRNERRVYFGGNHEVTIAIFSRSFGEGTAPGLIRRHAESHVTLKGWIFDALLRRQIQAALDAIQRLESCISS